MVCLVAHSSVTIPMRRMPSLRGCVAITDGYHHIGSPRKILVRAVRSDAG